jgi:hypothetical protein
MASACPMPWALSGIKMATWKALTGAGLGAERPQVQANANRLSSCSLC